MNNQEEDMWDRDYPTEEELVEAQREQEEASPYAFDDAEEDLYEEDFLDELDEIEEEESVLDNARIRLEQGRLYEMLINHNLFDGVDALPEAIDNVQKEIKNYIMERLEILLGMRSEKQTEIQQIIQEPQFNDMEVQALKVVASKLTKGASVSAPSAPRQSTESSGLNTISKPKENRGLNSLNTKREAAPKVAKKKAPKRVARKTLPPPPVAKAEKDNRNKTAEEIARSDIEYMETLKEKSIEEANRIVSERHKRPLSRKQINQEVVNQHYRTKVSMSTGSGSDMAKIMKQVALQKANQKG